MRIRRYIMAIISFIIIYLLVSYSIVYHIENTNKKSQPSGISVGDVFTYRDGRIVLNVSHNQVIYKQLFLMDGKWITTTNAMPATEFIKNWKKMEK